MLPWRRGGTNGDGELRCAPASYTDTDEHKIQHCFCYTSTVLTRTLAFQKEQKLKCECQVSVCRATPHACVCSILHSSLMVSSLSPQALLQVAKNLFTHLGRCIGEHPC